MRSRSAAIYRPAPPVGQVVARLETRAGPVGDLVAAVARRFELGASCIKLVPLEVAFDLPHPALGPAPPEQRAFFESQAVRRDVVRSERHPAAERLQPGIPALKWDRIDEVDVHVRHAP